MWRKQKILRALSKPRERELRTKHLFTTKSSDFQLEKNFLKQDETIYPRRVV